MSHGSQAAMTPTRDLSVTDLAYAILKDKGQAMYYKDLIELILEKKSIADENRGRVIAQIHTEINLDSRFFHKGQGEWGLRDWAPKPSVKSAKVGGKTARVAKTNRAALSYDDDDEERDELLENDEYQLEEEDNLGPEPDSAEDADGDEWE